MKKTFPCGHKGKGKYCHACAQEQEAAMQKTSPSNIMVRPPKTRDVLALLRDAGFTLVRTKGSHATYKDLDGRVIGIVINHLNDEIDFRAMLELRKLGVLQ